MNPPSAKICDRTVFMCSAINEIDMSALETLEAINGRLQGFGITLHLLEVKGPVIDQLHHANFLDDLTGRVFQSQYDAYSALVNRLKNSPSEVAD